MNLRLGGVNSKAIDDVMKAVEFSVRASVKSALEKMIMRFNQALPISNG